MNKLIINNSSIAKSNTKITNKKNNTINNQTNNKINKSIDMLSLMHKQAISVGFMGKNGLNNSNETYNKHLSADKEQLRKEKEAQRAQNKSNEFDRLYEENLAFDKELLKEEKMRWGTSNEYEEALALDKKLIKEEIMRRELLSTNNASVPAKQLVDLSSILTRTSSDVDDYTDIRKTAIKKLGELGKAHEELSERVFDILDPLVQKHESFAIETLGLIGVKYEKLAPKVLSTFNASINNLPDISSPPTPKGLLGQSYLDALLQGTELIGKVHSSLTYRSIDILKALAQKSDSEVKEDTNKSINILENIAKEREKKESEETAKLQAAHAAKIKAERTTRLQATWHDKIDNILVDSKTEPKYKANLKSYAYGAYSDIAGVMSEHPIAAKKIIELASNSNYPKIERLYDKFIENTLQSLALGLDKPASAKSPEFTAHWITNKKLGNKNLTNFWLNILGKDSKVMTPEEKLATINGLSKADKKTLIKATATEYVQNVLPAELNRLNNNDLQELDESQNINADTIRNLLDSGEYQNRKIGDKPIIDFWIDTAEGEGQSNKYKTPRIKQKRLAKLIEDDVNADKIVKETIKASGQTNTLVQTRDIAKKKKYLNKEPSSCICILGRV